MTYLQRGVLWKPTSFLKTLFGNNREVGWLSSFVVDIVLHAAPERLVCNVFLVMAVKGDENLSELVVRRVIPAGNEWVKVN